MNEFSGSGVAYTRNPLTGEKVLTGEYQKQAAGADFMLVKDRLTIPHSDSCDNSRLISYPVAFLFAVPFQFQFISSFYSNP